LTSEGADASEDGTGRGTPLVPVGIGLHGEVSGGFDDRARSVTSSHGQPGGVLTDSVRRLSPLECERLQGLDDDWTRWATDENGRTREQRDAPRYKQIGNGGAVPVMQWIGERIVAWEQGRIQAALGLEVA
jgi:DNA (cytosine-5)-methyltransferase 1